jgi:hypothetical protein
MTAAVESNEIAIVETTIVEAEIVTQLNKTQAKSLDKKIRSASDSISNGVSTLFDLMAQAAEGEIHLALGYNSISDYFSDAVQIAPSDTAERKLMAAMMSGKGISQRSIASVLGVGVGTVNRDLVDVEKGDTVSTDGRTFKKKDKEEPYIEAEDATEYHDQRKALEKAYKSVRAAADALEQAFDGDNFDADINPGDIKESIKDIKSAWSDVLSVFKVIGAIK